MAERMSFDIRLGSNHARERRRPSEESAMRILVMGDFSGRANRGIDEHAGLRSRRPTPIDVDSFDRVLAKMAPRLRLPIGDGSASVSLEFASIDDFHPDALYRRLALFQGLRETRRRLLDVSTYEEAAAAVRDEAKRRIGSRPTTGAAEPPPSPSEGDADTLARLLGGKPAGPAQQVRQTGQAVGEIDALIRSIVAPHIVADAPPHQAQYVAAVDAASSEQLRAILHHPQFQALEALWRGTRWLTANLETNERLQLLVLDVSRPALLADFSGAGADVRSSALHHLLVEQGSSTAGGEPWSLIVGDYSFGLSGEDLGLLASLGAVASWVGAPFLAAAMPDLIGCSSIASTPDPRNWTPPMGEVAEGWHALRQSMMASWIGLTLPRILLRLPYGKAGEPVEAFAFDEFGVTQAHEHYLWGNGALACALLIGRAFTARGWEMEPGDELEIEDMPAHVFEENGEKRLQACAEVTLVDRAAQAMLDAGLMPLLSYRNRNAIRLARFQSIANPAAPLSGPWG